MLYFYANPIFNTLMNKIFPAVLMFASISCLGAEGDLKVAVIGGLDMSGVWSRVETSAESFLDFDITTVIAAPKERVVPAFMRGDVDLLLIHGGDETFALEAMGYASALRTWGYNEFIIAGPRNDPAGIAQANSGREALLKIQASNQSLILFRDAGSHQILRRLMDSADLVPSQLQLIPDKVEKPQQILAQAASDQAYVIVGHLPVAFGRMQSDGIDVLLQGDPSMRRAYVIVTPGPQHPANLVARSNAEKLAEYLISEEGQKALEEPGPDEGMSWIFPRRDASGLLQFPKAQTPRRRVSGNQ